MLNDPIESMAAARGNDDDDRERRHKGKKAIRDREQLNERLAAGFSMMDNEEHEFNSSEETDAEDIDD